MKKYAVLFAILVGLFSIQSFANSREIMVDFEVVTSQEPSVQISWDSQPGAILLVVDGVGLG